MPRLCNLQVFVQANHGALHNNLLFARLGNKFLSLKTLGLLVCLGKSEICSGLLNLKKHSKRQRALNTFLKTLKCFRCLKLGVFAKVFSVNGLKFFWGFDVFKVATTAE